MGKIYDRLKARKKPAPATSTPVKPMFQSRPFVLPGQPSVQRQTPDYQAQLERARKFGHSLIRSKVTPETAIQPKLTIGAPGDQYEQEADQVASHVVSQINTPMTQMKGQGETLQPEKIEGGSLIRKPMVQQMSGGSEMTATSALETSLNQAQGSGQPLAGSVRQKMEKAFGNDFSGVKIHSDAKSDKLNKSIQAKAFTTGQEIFFRQGEYIPESRGGQELIAHELTHVVQQNGNKVQRQPIIQRAVVDEEAAIGMPPGAMEMTSGGAGLSGASSAQGSAAQVPAAQGPAPQVGGATGGRNLGSSLWRGAKSAGKFAVSSPVLNTVAGGLSTAAAVGGGLAAFSPAAAIGVGVASGATWMGAGGASHFEAKGLEKRVEVIERRLGITR